MTRGIIWAVSVLILKSQFFRFFYLMTGSCIRGVECVTARRARRIFGESGAGSTKAHMECSLSWHLKLPNGLVIGKVFAVVDKVDKG